MCSFRGDSHPYNSKHSTINSYSQLESPEKVNSLERNKTRINPLLNEINSLDSAVFGLGQNSYNQNVNTFNSQNSHNNNIYGSLPKTPQQQQKYLYNQHETEYMPYQQHQQQYYEDHYATPKHHYPTNNITNISPKPFTTANSKEHEYNLMKQYHQTSSNNDVSPMYHHYYPTTTKTDMDANNKLGGGGFTATEYGSNTYKLPDGQTNKSDSYIYKTYESQPLTTFSSDVQYVNELPTLKDSDTLEQRMLKKSVTQQITEKRTVSMFKSSRQESSSKTFKFD